MVSCGGVGGEKRQKGSFLSELGEGGGGFV